MQNQDFHSIIGQPFECDPFMTNSHSSLEFVLDGSSSAINHADPPSISQWFKLIMTKEVEAISLVNVYSIKTKNRGDKSTSPTATINNCLNYTCKYIFNGATLGDLLLGKNLLTDNEFQDRIEYYEGRMQRDDIKHDDIFIRSGHFVAFVKKYIYDDSRILLNKKYIESNTFAKTAKIGFKLKGDNLGKRSIYYIKLRESIQYVRDAIGTLEVVSETTPSIVNNDDDAIKILDVVNDSNFITAASSHQYNTLNHLSSPDSEISKNSMHSKLTDFSDHFADDETFYDDHVDFEIFQTIAINNNNHNGATDHIKNINHHHHHHHHDHHRIIALQEKVIHLTTILNILEKDLNALKSNQYVIDHLDLEDKVAQVRHRLNMLIIKVRDHSPLFIS